VQPDSKLNKSQRTFIELQEDTQICRGTKMTTTEIRTTTQYQSSARAEDGLQERAVWNSFCEGILIPLGSLGAIFLAMISVMLVAN
jgi:hypothetical protein